MRTPHPSPDLFDFDPLVPMGPGDPRPGRPRQRPSALVVDPDAATRIRLAGELAAAGYDVATCPGPCTSTLCPGRGRTGGKRCARLPADLALVVVDQASARTRLLEAYASWAPEARVEVRAPGSLRGGVGPTDPSIVVRP